MSNKKLIARFFEGFKQRDLGKMLSCYHEDIIFSDPAFGILRRNRVRAMWKMLCESAGDLQIEYSSIDADEQGGKAKWEAWYTFSETDREVHNKIKSEFKFKDGLIIEHHDSFVLRKWAGQAFGLRGKVIGGTSFFRKRIHGYTKKLLTQYVGKKK
ncbi:MAG: nuclear transport factor 2 family protein [Bacteroidota bacterium]